MTRTPEDIDALLSIDLAECHEPDWDGYGALPVNPEAIQQAKQFLLLLPSEVPLPSIGADPDGEVSFEWYQGPRQSFSVSVGEDGRLSYAGMCGRNKVQGKVYLGNEIPTEIMRHLPR